LNFWSLGSRLAEDIDQETFARKHTEFRDRLASIKLQLDVLDRSHDETAALASKVFELLQTLREQWLTAELLDTPIVGTPKGVD
jgi:site-specific DNA recombinase